MKSLKFIIKNRKMAYLLYIEDFLMFVLLFIPVFSLLLSTTSKNYYSINFTIDYVADILTKTRGLSTYFVILALTVIAYFVIRIFLLSGIFAKITDENLNCIENSGKNFYKFLGLWIIYLFIFIILSASLNIPFKKAIENTVNLKTAYYLKNTKILLTVALSLIISLFHNAARVKTTISEKFKPFAKPKKTLPFFGYQLLAILTTIFAVATLYWLITLNNRLGFALAFIISQIAILLKITLKLASYRTIV